MGWLKDLAANPFLITGVSSWMIAQIVKVVIHAAIHKKWDINRLFGDGGMPSGHSATVSSLAVMCALICGAESAEFAISAILAIIVCHDAMGVRMETGKQAIIINEMVRAFSTLTEEKMPEQKLKEFVGHTPIQVIAGVFIGVANAFIIHGVMAQ